MNPEIFLARHEARRQRAVEAATALLRGDGTSASAMLDGWLFRSDPGHVDLVLDALRSSPPRPTAGKLSALLDPIPASDHFALRQGDVEERLRVQDLLAAPSGERAADARDHVAWGLYLLSLLGQELERLERAGWEGKEYKERPALDEAARAWWALWLGYPTRYDPERPRPQVAMSTQQGAALVDGWKRLFRPKALEAWAKVLVQVNCPSSERKGHVAEMREASLAKLLDGGGAYLGWVELAARTVERCHRGQVAALARHAGEFTFHRAARCSAHRGSRSDTVRVLWPDLRDIELRAWQLERSFARESGQIEASLDLHLALTVLRDWHDPRACSLGRSWRVMRQQRGRTAARLRALLMEERPVDLLQDLIGAPALYERTLDTVRTYFWSWGLQIVNPADVRVDPDLYAWNEHGWHDDLEDEDEFYDGDRQAFAWLTGVGAHPGAAQLEAAGLFVVPPVDYDYATDRAITPACLDPDGDPALLSGRESAALQCWVLLVVMKGYLGQLHLWTETGGGDTGGGWGKLLSQDLPASLRDPSDEERKRSTYTRLRAALGRRLCGMIDELLPTIEALAAVDPRRAPKQAFAVILKPTWHPEVPYPASGFPTYILNAQSALAMIRKYKEDHPCRR